MDDFKSALKKIPKWGWVAIAGGFVLLLVVFRNKSAGGTEVESQLPSSGLDGGSPFESGGGGGGAPTWNGGSGDDFQGGIMPENFFQDFLSAFDAAVAERDEATNNQLTDTQAAASYAPTRTEIVEDSNMLSKFYTRLGFVDNDEDPDLPNAIKAFTLGFNSGAAKDNNYNTASWGQKASMVQSGKLLKSGDAAAISSELDRTNAVITYKESKGLNVSDQLKYRDKVTTALSGIGVVNNDRAQPVKQAAPPAPPKVSYLDQKAAEAKSTGNKGLATWVEAQKKAGAR